MGRDHHHWYAHCSPEMLVSLRARRDFHLMRTLLSMTGALLFGFSYGCARNHDDDEVTARTQTGNPSTARTGGSTDDRIAECAETCVNDAAECAAECTSGGNCAATCDSTFASCERECEQIGQ
jgi:hypothetical protein